MPQITKIETQKNKTRVNIFVDDSFFCGLNKETAVAFRLKEGMEIEENKLKHAIFESEVKSAFEKGLDILGRRMHSKSEISNKLALKGFSKEVVGEVIKRLEEYHYVDDRLFAKQFAQENSLLSKKMLSQKLFQKGISRDIIFEIIEDKTPDDEFEQCMRQANKYLRSKQLKTREDVAKLQMSLARKGFEFEIIKKICAQLNLKDEDEY